MFISRSGWPNTAWTACGGVFSALPFRWHCSAGQRFDQDVDTELTDVKQGGQADPELLNNLERCLTTLRDKVSVLGHAYKAPKQTPKVLLTGLMDSITMNNSYCSGRCTSL